MMYELCRFQVGCTACDSHMHSGCAQAVLIAATFFYKKLKLSLLGLSQKLQLGASSS